MKHSRDPKSRDKTVKNVERLLRELDERTDDLRKKRRVLQKILKVLMHPYAAALFLAGLVYAYSRKVLATFPFNYAYHYLSKQDPKAIEKTIDTAMTARTAHKVFRETRLAVQDVAAAKTMVVLGIASIDHALRFTKKASVAAGSFGKRLGAGLAAYFLWSINPARRIHTNRAWRTTSLTFS